MKNIRIFSITLYLLSILYFISPPASTMSIPDWIIYILGCIACTGFFVSGDVE